MSEQYVCCWRFCRLCYYFVPAKDQGMEMRVIEEGTHSIHLSTDCNKFENATSGSQKPRTEQNDQRTMRNLCSWKSSSWRFFPNFLYSNEGVKRNLTFSLKFTIIHILKHFNDCNFPLYMYSKFESNFIDSWYDLEKKIFIDKVTIYNISIYSITKTNGFHIAVGLFWNCSLKNGLRTLQTLRCAPYIITEQTHCNLEFTCLFDS